VEGSSAVFAATMAKDGWWRGIGYVGAAHELQAVEQPDSGLLRTMIMQDQKDPDQFYTLVVFESEEKARAREREPCRQEGLQVLRAMLADRLAGPPEFTDLAVVEEWTG
jgi:hypothetical protein